MHPHPGKQPNLTRKFPLTEMPTGLMAALVPAEAFDRRAVAAAAGPVVAGAELKPRQRGVAGQADTFACRLWPGAAVRCGPGARCE
jgi:hypothetical protein